MPSPRPMNFLDVMVRALVGQQNPIITRPGQVLNTIQLAVGGLTIAGLNQGSSVAQRSTWLAVGTGTQAFSGTLTALAAEIARAPVGVWQGSGLTEFVQAVFGPIMAAGVWTEIGVFGGTASITPGSGTLYAYCLLVPAWLKHMQKSTILQWSAQ